MNNALRRYVRKHDIRIAKKAYRSIIAPLYGLVSIPLYDITSSASYRYTWFRIPKNGTHSIMQLLNAVAPPEINSSSVPYFQKQHAENFRFCVLRNPWDRLVSVYCNKVRMKLMYRECWDKDFDFFIEFVSRQNLRKCDAHLRLQTMLFPTTDMDFVGHIEHFEDDIAYVLKKLGKEGTITREGQIPHEHYKSFYTSALRDRVNSLYEADVRYGKYIY